MSSSLGYLAQQQVVEDAAGDRRGRLGAEAGVLDDHRQRHGRRLQRRGGDVQRVVALVLFQLGGVVLLVLPDAHRLRGAGLAAAAIGRAGEDARRGALLRHAVQRALDQLDMLGRQRKRLQRLAATRLALARDHVFDLAHQARPKRWPPLTSVAVALASCSMVKLL
jgi:hypothetical protein